MKHWGHVLEVLKPLLVEILNFLEMKDPVLLFTISPALTDVSTDVYTALFG